MSVQSAYAHLEDVFRRHAAIGEAVGVLHWDMSVMMPRNGSEARAEQMSVLQVAAHALITDPATAERLDEAEGKADGLDAWQLPTCGKCGGNGATRQRCRPTWWRRGPRPR